MVCDAAALDAGDDLANLLLVEVAEEVRPSMPVSAPFIASRLTSLQRMGMYSIKPMRLFLEYLPSSRKASV
jgi:hypothetical protein